MRGLFGSLSDAAADVVRRNEVDITALLARNFGLMSKAGVNITIDRALAVTTVLACTRAHAEGIAQIPFKLIREDENEQKAVARKHAAHRVVARRPNEWQTSFGFRETMMYHAVLTEGGLAFKNTVRGQLKELIPIEPGCWRVCRGQRLGDPLVYEIYDRGEKFAELDRSQVFHITGPSWNGYRGLEMIKLAREAIGLSIATEENHALMHANGSQVGGILTTEKELKQAQIDRIKAMWAAAQEGNANKFKTALLDAGMKYERMAMSGVESQHIETREHQIQEICRALNIFPMIIGFADKTATFASAEAFFTAHVVLSLGPWVQRWQDTCNLQLLSEEDFDNGHYFKLFTSGLVRGDLRSRFEAYKTGILTGFMTRNQARELEEWNKLEGLDEPLVPLNMNAVGQETPDPNVPADQRPQSTPLPNLPIVPKSVADAMRALLMGHNGGPRLEDDAAPRPRRSARHNIGRVLSGANERRLREASGLITEADGKLTEVLDELEDDDEDETQESVVIAGA